MLRKSAVICVVAFVVVAVIPAISQGQEKGKTLVSPTPTIDGDNVTQIFRIEFADVEDIASVISLFGGIVRPQPDLSVIAWTGPESQLPAVEAAIRSLDVAPVPEPNVEITVFFVMASKGGSGKTSVPATLDGVAAQLQDVFGYDTAELIETTAMRVRHGSRSTVNGILPRRLADDREARYAFGFRRLFVTEDEGGRSIRLDGVEARIQAPHTVVVDGQTTTKYMATGIETDIDLREGQKAVIGKTSIEGGAETVFVVVTALIIE
jgi:hypothetical protein